MVGVVNKEVRAPPLGPVMGRGRGGGGMTAGGGGGCWGVKKTQLWNTAVFGRATWVTDETRQNKKKKKKRKRGEQNENKQNIPLTYL